jgi:acyl-CoA dehydrogenase
MVGAMERAIDYAVIFAKERVQFGKRIGQFQAVQHALAEAVGLLALATAAVDVASANHRCESFALSAAIAKATAGDAAGRVAAICHQVLGAMGFAQEHNLHLSTRRLLSWREEFGNETYWRTVVGRKICLAGGAALWQTLLKTAASFDERAA